MPDIAVGPRSLREAAKAADDAASQVRELDLSEVAELAAALPDTRVAGYANMLSAHLERTRRTWSKATSEYGKKLVVVADRYEADDAAIEADFGGNGIREW